MVLFSYCLFLMFREKMTTFVWDGILPSTPSTRPSVMAWGIWLVLLRYMELDTRVLFSKDGGCSSMCRYDSVWSLCLWQDTDGGVV